MLVFSSWIRSCCQVMLACFHGIEGRPSSIAEEPGVFFVWDGFEGFRPSASQDKSTLACWICLDFFRFSPWPLKGATWRHALALSSWMMEKSVQWKAQMDRLKGLQWRKEVQMLQGSQVFLPIHVAMGQNPGTPVNTQKAFKIDYNRVGTIPKKGTLGFDPQPCSFCHPPIHFFFKGSLLP